MKTMALADQTFKVGEITFTINTEEVFLKFRDGHRIQGNKRLLRSQILHQGGFENPLSGTSVNLSL